VKRRWSPEGEYEELSAIHANDRENIKTAVVDLLCCTPPDVQKQLAEAVSIISNFDFPDNWKNLLPQLVQQAASDNPLMLRGVMLTANSIMKRFRYVAISDSDDLMIDLIECLKGFQEVLLHSYRATWAKVVVTTDVAALKILLETQRLMARVYYSFNWPTIPEFFEDHLAEWLEVDASILQYNNPALIDTDEDNESGPIELLQAAVVENTNLYVEKYEEEFLPHMGTFTGSIWKLLMEVGPQPKLDSLATQSIKFLTVVAGKTMHEGLFSDQVLQDIVQHIVIKNLTATEADEELFEDNPADYINKDFEGTDQGSRRRCALDLVRSMMQNFPDKVSTLCEGFIGSMLAEHHKSGGSNWKLKDTALHLFLACAAMNQGCTVLNPRIQMQAIITSHVLPELQSNDVNAASGPLVRASALKMLCLFKSHLPADFIVSLLPFTIAHLKSSHVVVQTYAAICIEKWLAMKEPTSISTPGPGNVVMKVSKAQVLPFLNVMFTELFGVLDNTELTEIDAFIKCVMRILVIVGSDIQPLTALVLQKLTVLFGIVAKNPIHPYYNHYLFECYALLIKSNCVGAGVDPVKANSACDAFEAALFPPFQEVLNLDISEFTPYVFQLLSQLLAFRPGNSLSEPYRVLFAPLLSPTLWERRGNVPALVQLLHSYISRDVATILQTNSLPGVLGVFQKLLSSRVNEPHAFKLINSLLALVPPEAMKPYLSTVMDLLLKKLQEAAKSDTPTNSRNNNNNNTVSCKNIKFVRGFLNVICCYCNAHGSQAACDLLDSIQAGLMGNICVSVWGRLSTIIGSGLGPGEKDKIESCHIIKGLSKMLTETNSITTQPNAWIALLSATTSLVSTLGIGNISVTPSASTSESIFVEESEVKEFDSAYSKLIYASIPSEALTAEDNNAPMAFIVALTSMCSSKPGTYSAAIESSCTQESKDILHQLCAAAGVTIV
jgi:exportin-2 (importin alpha re-exporter)